MKQLTSDKIRTAQHRALAPKTLPSTNTIKKDTPMHSAYAISIDEQNFSAPTVDFIRAYNTGLVKTDKIESTFNMAIQSIGLRNIESQFTLVLTMATFRNDQVKQTFKIACQRFISRNFKGKALVITKNAVKLHTLSVTESVGVKGQVVKLDSPQDKANKKKDADAKAAKKEELLKNAEQNELRLESEETARKQAETVAAAAVKKVNEADKTIKKVEDKAKNAADILSLEIVELKAQLERVQFENHSTVQAYTELKELVMSAKTLKALKSKVA